MVSVVEFEAKLIGGDDRNVKLYLQLRENATCVRIAAFARCGRELRQDLGVGGAKNHGKCKLNCLYFLLS
jgi:hypothetical protein